MVNQNLNAAFLFLKLGIAGKQRIILRLKG